MISPVNEAPKTVEEAYDLCEGTIKGLACKYATKKGIELDEAMSVCHQGFMLAWQKFNPNAGAKFNTWVHTQISFELRNHDKREFRHRKRFGELCGDEVLQLIEKETPSTGELVQKVYSRVSEDAREAITFALANERLKKREVRKHFREVAKWPNHKADNVWREVRNAFAD